MRGIPAILVGLSGLVPDPEPEPMPLRCRCGAILEDLMPRSLADAGFVPLCSADCMPAVPNGQLHNLPKAYRDR